MRYLVVTLALLFSGCTDNAQAARVVALVQQNCGVLVSVVDVATALSQPNPTVIGVDAVAHAICNQWQLKASDAQWFVLVQDQQQQDTKNCAAVVNGVCIRKKGD